MAYDPEMDALKVQLKRLRTLYFAGILFILYLAFTGELGGFWFFWLFFWTILSFGAGLYIVINQIRCPTCHVRLLSRQAIKSPDKCYNCGRSLGGPTPSKRDIADELFEKHGDERAAKTSWTSIKSETANFDTHKLRFDKYGQPHFKPTIGNYSFAAVFLFFGVVGYTAFYLATSAQGGLLMIATLIPLVFVVAGLYLAHLAITPIRIKRKSGLFILGWGADDKVFIGDIKAVQLLPYRSRNYSNVQIILVLADHSRKPVVTYFRRDKALKDAGLLASHLGVPLWNGLQT